MVIYNFKCNVIKLCRKKHKEGQEKSIIEEEAKTERRKSCFNSMLKKLTRRPRRYSLDEIEEEDPNKIMRRYYPSKTFNIKSLRDDIMSEYDIQKLTGLKNPGN